MTRSRCGLVLAMVAWALARPAAERPERARVLWKRLHAWRQGVGAAMPRPNPEPAEP
ncbi:MAG: hypothetical protein ACKOSQ_11335 [Planctomycetaceae bacterium]